MQVPKGSDSFDDLNSIICNIPHQKIAAEELENKSANNLDKNLNLDSYFGTILVVNLDRSKGRLGVIAERLEVIGLSYGQWERFKAIEGKVEFPTKEDADRMSDTAVHGLDPNAHDYSVRLTKSKQGKLGLYKTMYEIFKKMNHNYKEAHAEYLEALQNNAPLEVVKQLAQRVRKYSSVLVLQDDTNFGRVLDSHQESTMKGVGVAFRHVMEELPQDWDTLHLNHATYWHDGKSNEAFVRPSSFTAVEQLKYSVLANAVAYNQRAYEKLEEIFSKVLNPAKDHIDRSPDNELAHFQESNRCYGAWPTQITFQYAQDASTTLNATDSAPDQMFQGGLL